MALSVITCSVSSHMNNVNTQYVYSRVCSLSIITMMCVCVCVHRRGFFFFFFSHSWTDHWCVKDSCFNTRHLISTATFAHAHTSTRSLLMIVQKDNSLLFSSPSAETPKTLVFCSPQLNLRFARAPICVTCKSALHIRFACHPREWICYLVIKENCKH